LKSRIDSYLYLVQLSLEIITIIITWRYVGESNENLKY
jgi:hypothetical protein